MTIQNTKESCQETEVRKMREGHEKTKIGEIKQ
jgi:hypothetical protein